MHQPSFMKTAAKRRMARQKRPLQRRTPTRYRSPAGRTRTDPRGAHMMQTCPATPPINGRYPAGAESRIPGEITARKPHSASGGRAMYQLKVRHCPNAGKKILCTRYAHKRQMGIKKGAVFATPPQSRLNPNLPGCLLWISRNSRLENSTAYR